MFNSDDSPLTFLEKASDMLSEGVLSSKHPFRQLVVATKSLDDVELRTVVLRKWVLKRRTIIFHTDIRSPKVKELKDAPNCSLLFYSKADKLQLRFKCIAHVHHQDRLSNYLLSQTTPQQRECYQFPIPPGHHISSINKEHYMKSMPSLKPEDAQNNFAACVCNFSELDLLYLQYDGHIRLRYKWDKHHELSISNIVA